MKKIIIKIKKEDINTKADPDRPALVAKYPHRVAENKKKYNRKKLKKPEID